MRYESAQALRMALEQRLLTRSQETGVSLDRLRRGGDAPSRSVHTMRTALAKRSMSSSLCSSRITRSTAELPRVPASWSDRYERLAAEQELQTTSFATAVALVAGMWADMSLS